MRWTHPEPPEIGDYRNCSGFLWFPRQIGNETRWLERARWIQEYRDTKYSVGGSVRAYRGWYDFCWLEDDE